MEGAKGDGERAEERKTKLSSPPPAIGRTKIGRYDVIYPLAQGGMASVHVGRLSGMAGFEKLVAIKVIHPHLSGDESFVRMFLDEARLAARIHHPNVGEIIEVGEDEGLFFMVGELIVGQSLRNLFRKARDRGEQVSHTMCADIVAKVCQGLNDAHDLKDPRGELYGVVHRDVSPRNVLISYNGFVKLIDFGIAWAHGRMSHTDAGTIKGKLGFMPPEQIKGQPLDRRSDIFSLGVVLYLMLTGKHPFPGNSDAERMHKILHGDFLRPREVDEELDPVLEQVVLRAMEVTPDARYDTAAEMGRKLMSFVHANADPSGSWDSSTEIAGLMHGLFETELAEHREQIRIAAEESGANADQEISGLTSGAAAKAASASHTDFTVAGTPQSMQIKLFGKRRRLFGLGIAGAAVLLAAIAVIVAVATGDGSADAAAGAADDLELAGTAGSALPDPADAEEQTSPNADAGEPPTIRVVFRVRPDDAVIAVDGEPLEAGARELTLPADGESHQVEISAEGYRTATEEIVADVNQKITRRLERLPRKKPGKKKPGKKKPDGKKPGGLGLIDSPY
jgi:serine/threonine-protein kinase